MVLDCIDLVIAPLQAPLPAKMLVATSSPALFSRRTIGLKNGGAAAGVSISNAMSAGLSR